MDPDNIALAYADGSNPSHETIRHWPTRYHGLSRYCFHGVE